MKTVLITGSNRGIGLEFAKQYSKDGWSVLACCRNPELALELKKIKSKNIEIVKLDLNEIDEIIKLRSQFKNRSLDILINNAGIAGTEDSFDTVAPETLLNTFHINTLAPTLIAQALINSLEIGLSKIIVNISSYYGSI